MKKQIPNIITLMNFLCGVLSIVALLLWDNPLLSSIFIICGAVFDFLDGLTARALKVSGAIGKELDSLADVVSFGVAPSLIAVSLLLGNRCNYEFLNIGGGFLCYIPLFMAVMSCYRLAKFNIDERQSLSFIGLPTPANAIVWLSIPIINHMYINNVKLWGINSEGMHEFLYSVMNNPWFIIVFSILLAILLVSEVPLFSLKFKNLNWQNNKTKFVFIICTLVMLLLLNLYCIPLIIILYILLSIIENISKKSKV